MKTIIRSSHLICISLVATIGVFGQVQANTPDGMTPAVETLCDAYQDSIPGLYGLCVAYCEAQDLDEFEKEPTEGVLEGNFARRGGAVPIDCGGNEED